MPSNKDTVHVKKDSNKVKSESTEKAKVESPSEENQKTKNDSPKESKAEVKKNNKAEQVKKADESSAKKAEADSNKKNNSQPNKKDTKKPDTAKPATATKEAKPAPVDENLDETIVRTNSSAKKKPAKKLSDDIIDDRPEDSTKRPNYEIGDKIANRYQLVVKLGSGGTSDVYKARDLLLEGDGLLPVYVAIKILNRSNEDFFNVIRSEVIKTRGLDHPNIVRIHDFNYDKNVYFIVMELLEGEPLDEIIKRSRPKGLSVDQTFYIAERIADALKYTHRKGIIHSDLKPANIYLTKDNEVKIYDFGVARHFEEIDDYAAIDTSNSDKEDNFTGYTPAYASAELIEGQTATVKDDIYSFACIIYEMLSSEHPYERMPANKAIQQNKQLKKAVSLNSSQWSSLEQALSLDPNKRTKTIERLFQNLFEDKKQKNLLIGAACAAGALVLITGIILFNNHSAKQDKIALTKKSEKYFASLMDTPQSDILASIPSIEKLEEPNKSVFLQAQRIKIITAATQNADSVISNKQSNLYLDAIQKINSAQSIYPDSHTLFIEKQKITKTFEQRRATVIKNLQQAFVEPTYDSKEVRLKIKTLATELAEMDPSYTLVPSLQAHEVYEAYTQEALDGHLFNKLVIAKDFGQLYFSKSPAFKNLLSKGDAYLGAADNLYTYQTNIIKTPGLPFPDEDAKTLFSELLKSLLNNKDLVENGNGIELAHKHATTFLAATPKSPAIAKELRSQLFSSYIYLGSTFTTKGLGDPARLILEKAQELNDANN